MLRGGFRAGKTPWGGTHPGRGRKERSEHSCGTQAGEEVREEPRGHASIQGAGQEGEELLEKRKCIHFFVHLI